MQLDDVGLVGNFRKRPLMGLLLNMKTLDAGLRHS